MKGFLLKIPVVLGSATPSSESWQNSLDGKYYLEKLKERANSKPLPSIKIYEYKGDNYIPTEVIEKVKQDISEKKQALFFLNRRGFATIALCDSCSEIEKCPNCEVAMVYHKKIGKLLCHHCSFQKELSICGKCGEKKVRLQGMGIEKLTESLSLLFPDSSIISIDRDSIKNDVELAEVVEDVENGTHDIIVGTVMVSKGHNFPKLKTVVVKFADYLINFSDYRAGERCFQVISQVAGRAGRFADEGVVFAESMKKDHYIWKYLINNNYEGFIEEELEWRKQLGLPPFSHIILIKIASSKKEITNQFAEKLFNELSLKINSENNTLYPPSEPPLHRVGNRFRLVISITTFSIKNTVKTIDSTLKTISKQGKVTVTVDIDALSSF